MRQPTLDAPDVDASPTEPEPVVKTLPPLARGVLESVAVEHGVCIRPVPMRRVDLTSGTAEMVYVPCGHTLASVCPSPAACSRSGRRRRSGRRSASASPACSS